MPGLDATKRTLAATEQDAAARAQWRDEIADESSTNDTLPPRSALAPKGQRSNGSARRNYVHNATLVAALTPTGIPAARTLPGALGGLFVSTYVEQVLHYGYQVEEQLRDMLQEVMRPNKCAVAIRSGSSGTIGAGIPTR